VSAAALIAEAAAAGVRLSRVGDNRLKWRCTGPPPADLLARIAAQKPAVLAALASEEAPSPWFDPAGPLERDPAHRAEVSAAIERQRWRDMYEERAGVREHDGAMSRGAAEAAALDDLVQLWRSENPLPASDAAACAYCGKRGADTPVLARGGHAWLHKPCWGPMNEARQQEAMAAVQALLRAAP
jgi:hypothetical protein